MKPQNRPIPQLFWNRFLLVIIFITGGYVGMKALPKYVYMLNFIDPSLLFCVALVATIIGWFVFFRTVENPFITSVIPIFFLLWMILDGFLGRVAVSFKPHLLALLFIFAGGIVIFYQKFAYLWQFNAFRYFTVFALINIIYFFFHSSDFNISEIGPAYGGLGGSYGQDAKVVVLLDALIALFAFCLPAVFFSRLNSKEQLDNYINKISYIFLFGFLAFILLLPITIKCLPTGKQIFIPLTIFFMLGLKLYIDRNFTDKSNWFNFGFFIISIGTSFVLIAVSNKAALMGFLGAMSLFIFLNLFIIKNKFKIIDIKGQKYLVPAITALLLIIALVIAVQLNLLDEAIYKFNKTFSSFQGITSWYIRQSNWGYFMLEWKNHLDVVSALFGFGLGASRETIFYISAMQYSPIYLVQTTHSQYMEMFYDYGLMAILFYIPILGITVKDTIAVFNKNMDNNIRIFCTVNLAMISFFLVYHLVDGLRVQTVILFFSFLGFNEMAKHYLLHLKDKEPNRA